MDARSGGLGATIGTILTLLAASAVSYLEDANTPDHLGVCLDAITRCDCTGRED